MNRSQLRNWIENLKSVYEDEFPDVSFLEQGKGLLDLPIPNLALRYIRFELESKEIFHLHSVDLRDKEGGRLPSSGISLSASSHHGKSRELLRARNFLDPTHQGFFGFHTCKENNPWLKLSLPAPVRLSGIMVRNRTDGCAARAAGLRISVSVDDVVWITLYDGGSRVKMFRERASWLWGRVCAGLDPAILDISVNFTLCRYRAALRLFESDEFPAALRALTKEALVDLVLEERGLEWDASGIRQKRRIKFYSIDASKFERRERSVREVHGTLETKEYKGAVILPLRKIDLSRGNVYEGGVCDDEFNFIAGYERRGRNNEGINNTCVRSYIPEIAIDEIDDDVAFLGIYNKHFGHFLTDGMSRMHALDSLPPEVKLAYVYVPTRKRVFYTSVLELLGIDPGRLLLVDKPIRFRTVYVPGQSILFFESFNKDFLRPYDAILRNLRASSSLRKIYLSRSRLKVPDCVNEKYFEEFYSERGFHIVHPQMLSFEEQVAIVHNAEYIVSTVGTLTHLAVFAKPGTRLVGLIRSSDFVPKIQYAIDRLRGLNSTYVDVSCNFLPSHRLFRSLYIGPNEHWREFVRDEYGIEIGSNIWDYINREGSDFGLYLEQWLRTFAGTREAKYVRNQSAEDLMKSILTAEPSYFKKIL